MLAPGIFVASGAAFFLLKLFGFLLFRGTVRRSCVMVRQAYNPSAPERNHYSRPGRGK
jgi:hypothetical protein